MHSAPSKLMIMLVIITDASFHLHDLKRRLSSPIFLDTVACYGSEHNLIDCSYHTDTSEDQHSQDIWVTCVGNFTQDNGKQNSGNKDSEDLSGTSDMSSLENDVEQNSVFSVAALSVSVILIVCSVLVFVAVMLVVVKFNKTGKSLCGHNRQVNQYALLYTCIASMYMCIFTSSYVIYSARSESKLNLEMDTCDDKKLVNES